MKPVFPIATIAATLSAAFLMPSLAMAQTATSKYPITAQQRTAAKKVAEQGVAISELAPNAPDEYVVKRGDTLWGISGKFLKSPWRWPALWGMNLDQIRNPHLIYPGQRLWLEKVNGRARLRLAKPIHAKQHHAVFIFDEPTIGLHPQDVHTLMGVMDRLLNQGATIIAVDHDLDLIANADYLLEMGPGSGAQGGQIVACGTVDEVKRNPSSRIAPWLTGRKP